MGPARIRCSGEQAVRPDRPLANCSKTGQTTRHFSEAETRKLPERSHDVSALPKLANCPQRATMFRQSRNSQAARRAASHLPELRGQSLILRVLPNLCSCLGSSAGLLCLGLSISTDPLEAHATVSEGRTPSAKCGSVEPTYSKLRSSFLAFSLDGM